MDLKDKASKATQGEWEYTGSNGVDYECSECGEQFPESGWSVKSKDEYQVLECHLYGMERFCKPDGEYIASANPTVVQEIITRLIEAEETLKLILMQQENFAEEAWINTEKLIFEYQSKYMKRAQLAERKLEKLKRLMLLVDESVSDEIMNPLTIKQWNEFIREFPDEADQLTKKDGVEE